MMALRLAISSRCASGCARTQCAALCGTSSKMPSDMDAVPRCLSGDGAETVAIEIIDNGAGIPSADLERVFEPFFRLEKSRSRNTGGTGLGLSIARTIARAHGGDVRLENRPEGGLMARSILPRKGRDQS